MLAIILKILGIIGLILLVILGVVLTLLLIVLFVPICYRVRASKQDQIEAQIKASWLFGLLRARFIYPEPGRFIVKVLFFTVYDSGKEDEEKTVKPKKIKNTKKTKVVNKPEKTKKEASKQEQTEVLTEMTSNDSNLNESEKISTIQSEYSEQEESNQEDYNKNASGEKESIFERITNKTEKIKYTIENLCDKIKHIKEDADYYKEVLTQEETKQLLAHVLKRVGKVLKSIRPRKIKADVLFGTGSPDTTGYAFAVYGMICPYLGKHVIVTPDFDEAILKGEVDASGHITIFRIAWNGLMLAVDKKLWRFIAKINKEE